MYWQYKLCLLSWVWLLSPTNASGIRQWIQKTGARCTGDSFVSKQDHGHGHSYHQFPDGRPLQIIVQSVDGQTDFGFLTAEGKIGPGWQGIWLLSSNGALSIDHCYIGANVNPELPFPFRPICDRQPDITTGFEVRDDNVLIWRNKNFEGDDHQLHFALAFNFQIIAYADQIDAQKVLLRARFLQTASPEEDLRSIRVHGKQANKFMPPQSHGHGHTQHPKREGQIVRILVQQEYGPPIGLLSSQGDLLGPPGAWILGKDTTLSMDDCYFGGDSASPVFPFQPICGGRPEITTGFQIGHENKLVWRNDAFPEDIHFRVGPSQQIIAFTSGFMPGPPITLRVLLGEDDISFEPHLGDL